MDRQHLRILNLEDSVIDSELLVRELKRAEFDLSVTRVDNERAFVAALESSDPDVILADYNLPGFDGIAALKIARRLVPEIPFIFVSGSIGEDRAVQALREGATDYVIKDRMSRLPSAIMRAITEKRERQLRQRTQEALRQSEERLAYAASATQEVIWDWDLATWQISFNEALRTLWGYDLPTNEVDVKWYEAHLHPEDRAAVMESVRAAIRDSDRWSRDYRFERADGSYGHVIGRAVIIRDGRGKARRKICTMLDITPLLEATQNLMQSEASLAEAQEMAKLGSFSCDLGSGELEWSDQTYRIFGFAPGDIEPTYDKYLNCVHPDDREYVRELMTPPLKSEGFSFRHRIVCPDGEIRYLHCRVRVGAGTTEAPEKIVGTVQDVSEQVESEETIRRLSHQNEMILNSAAEGILGILGNGTVMFANPAAAELTGWSVEALTSTPNIHDLIHHSRPNGDPYPEDECPVYQVMIDGKPRHGEEVFFRKTDEPFSADISCSPMLEGNRIIGCVAMLADITDRKRLERELAQANRVSSLGRVAATIAHEFNNVLMGIQPFAEVIRRRATDEKTEKAAAQIANSVVRGKRVTQEILRFTQPSEPALQAINIGEWFQQLVPELQNLAGPQVEIVLDISAEPIVVRGDPSQLHQVVANLVLNARDAMAGKGIVTITARAGATGQTQFPIPTASDVAVITVRDTGLGMPPSLLEHIFEPLFTTKRTGTGLGLAVAQQIIGRHGGTIYAESKSGEGTTFFIVLPTADAEPEQPLARASGQPSRVRRIVLVEDEVAVASGLVLLLESEGFSVRVVELGAEALGAIEDFRPDVVVLDMTLPDMHGTKVHERIAAQYPSMPVLFSSGHAEESLVERYGNDHVGFLRKPYDFDALIAALEKITQRTDAAVGKRA